MKLLLIRHGKMAGDPYVRPARPVTGSLSDAVGIPQARALSARLKDEPIDIALSSPYGRALQTAEIALAGRDVPIRILDCLIEWQPDPALKNATSTQFEAIMQLESQRCAEETWKTELGEGCFDMYARIIPPFLAALADLGIRSRQGGFVPDAAAATKTVAVFAHGGSLSVVLAHLLGVRPFPVGSFHIEETAVATIEFTERQGIHYPVLRIPQG